MASCCSCILFGQLVSATHAWGKYSSCFLATLVIFVLQISSQSLTGEAGTNEKTDYNANDWGANEVVERRHPKHRFAIVLEDPVTHNFCLVAIVIVMIMWFLKYQLRERVVQGYGIKESRAFTFFAAVCCDCCSLAQMARHVFAKPYEEGTYEKAHFVCADPGVVVPFNLA